ncbi:Hypothetical predicted protein [Octopus vulgaris]|uniref:Uncharacterized protein n=1 Tax=Octopus vulgaris TaxID=6645 RepID=A0AA36AJW9_OCTVU|nr:Hypothetical predicted protein [Octopus vulgaris]
MFTCTYNELEDRANVGLPAQYENFAFSESVEHRYDQIFEYLFETKIRQDDNTITEQLKKGKSVKTALIDYQEIACGNRS